MKDIGAIDSHLEHADISRITYPRGIILRWYPTLPPHLPHRSRLPTHSGSLCVNVNETNEKDDYLN